MPNFAKAALRMQPTDLQAVIDQSLRSLRPRLKSQSDSSGIQVVCDYGQLSAVECSSEISQVFTILIAQAIEALSPHKISEAAAIQRPQVMIRTMQIPDPQGGNPRAVVCVADNGAAIPFEEQSQIFTAVAGTRAGSALSTCYEIVMQHGGDLQCYSQSGRTEFWVELPVKQAFPE
jgi:two-component system, NtrC family, sensor kinase